MVYSSKLTKYPEVVDNRKVKSFRIPIIAIFSICLILVGTVGFARASAADESMPLTDAQLQAVQTSCVTLKQTLTQLNQNDTVVRVYQGQYYEEILSKLMAPMNSRIAMNHYDGADLVSTAANFSDTLNTFRAQYKSYASALTKAMNGDCTNHPQQFYDAISAARTDRDQLHETVVTLNGMVNAYADQFSNFAKTLPVSSNGNTND